MNELSARVRVIVMSGDRILMVQQRGAEGYFWILPGGGVEPGETPEQAAVREVWEETGARCNIVRRLTLPEGVSGMTGYGLVLGRVATEELAAPKNIDGEDIYAAAWWQITDKEPVGPLNPRSWAPIADLFRTLRDTTQA